jgi:hypothetical protein
MKPRVAKLSFSAAMDSVKEIRAMRLASMLSEELGISTTRAGAPAVIDGKLGLALKVATGIPAVKCGLCYGSEPISSQAPGGAMIDCSDPDIACQLEGIVALNSALGIEDCHGDNAFCNPAAKKITVIDPGEALTEWRADLPRQIRAVSKPMYKKIMKITENEARTMAAIAGFPEEQQTEFAENLKELQDYFREIPHDREHASALDLLPLDREMVFHPFAQPAQHGGNSRGKQPTSLVVELCCGDILRKNEMSTKTYDKMLERTKKIESLVNRLKATATVSQGPKSKPERLHDDRPTNIGPKSQRETRPSTLAQIAMSRAVMPYTHWRPEPRTPKKEPAPVQ